MNQCISRLQGCRLLAISLALGSALLLTACGLLLDPYVEFKVRDKSDRSLLEKDGDVRVVTCGTGTPQVNAQRGQACTLVSAGGMLFLFDAGENTMRNLEKSRVAVGSVARVFITHWHSDHFNGLGALINHSWINGRAEPFTVYGPPGVERVVKAIADTYADDVRYRAENVGHDLSLSGASAVTIAIAAGKESVQVYDKDGVTIHAHLASHTPVEPAYAYTLHYRGRKVFISGDTRVTPQLETAMRDADIAVHEAANTKLLKEAAVVLRRLGRNQQAEVAEHVGHYHADTLEVAAAAQRARVKHLVLTHLTPAPDSWVSNHLFTKGMSDHYKGKLTIAEDGMHISP
jgi:ribonuclease Z